MGNVYSAQNVAAYFIYELNELDTFINGKSIQQLLAAVEVMWNKTFGHSAFSEEKHALESTGYLVKEVYEAYKEHGIDHIILPAKEWYLAFGQFQLVHRTYGIPAFTRKEEMIVRKILEHYRTITSNKKVSIAV